MKIDPVTPEITMVKTAPFLDDMEKSSYHTKYLSKYGTDRHQHISIGR